MSWVAFLLLQVGLARAEPSGGSASAVRVERLAAGLTLIVEQVPDTGVVGSFVYVPGGAASDPAEAPGLAHLVEHLAFTGTEGAPGSAWDSAVTAMGGWTNAWTDGAGIGLFSEVPAGGGPRLVALEVDRLLHLAPTPASVGAQLGVVAAERRAAGDRADQRLAALLWPSGHPLHADPMGSPAALARLPFETIREAARARLSPARAVWALVGDLDPDATIEQVRAGLSAGLTVDGTEPPRAPPDIRPAPVLPQPPSVRRAWMRTDVARAARTRGWTLPPDAHPDAAALRLIGRMVGGRVFLGPAGGTLFLDRADGQRVLDFLRRMGPGPGALDIVRGQGRSADADAMEQPWTRAEALALCVAGGWTYDCVERARRDEEAVDAAQLREVARRWLDARRSILLTRVPRGALGFGRAGLHLKDTYEPSMTTHDTFDVSEDASEDGCRPCAQHPVAPQPVPSLPEPAWTASIHGVEVDHVGTAGGAARAAGVGRRVAAVLSIFPDEPLTTAERSMAEAMLARMPQMDALGARVRVGCGMARCRVQVEALPDTLVMAVSQALAGLDDPRLPAVGWWMRERRHAARWSRMAPGGQLTVTEAALERLVLPDAHPLRERAPPPQASAFRRTTWRTVRERLRRGRTHVAIAGELDRDVVDAIAARVAASVVRHRGDGSTPRALGALPGPTLPLARVVVVDLPGADSVEVRVAWEAPGARAPRADDDGGAERVALAARAWGEDATAVLDRTLRGTLGVTYGMRAAVRDVGGGSLLVVSGAVSAHDADRAFPALRALVVDPVLTDADIEGRRAAAAREAWSVRRSALGLALVASDGAALDRTLSEQWQRILDVSDVSPDEVRAALRDVVDGPAVWVLSGDAARIEDALMAADLPTDAVWSAARAVRGPR